MKLYCISEGEYDDLEDDDQFADNADPEYYMHVIHHAEIWKEGEIVAIVDWVMGETPWPSSFYSRSRYDAPRAEDSDPFPAYYLYEDLTGYPPETIEQANPDAVFRSWDEMIAGIKHLSDVVIRTGLASYYQELQTARLSPDVAAQVRQNIAKVKAGDFELAMKQILV